MSQNHGLRDELLAEVDSIAPILAEHAAESGRSVDALFAIRQAEAIVRALELAGYEIKSRT